MPFVADFKETYKNPQKTLILCHNDADGVTSAVIIAKALDNYGLKYKKDYNVLICGNEIRREDLPDSNPVIQEIASAKIIIYLDYLSKHAKGKGKKIFVIDHHDTQDISYSPDEATSLVPIDHERRRPSASALCYAVYSSIFGENQEIKIIGAIGAVGDSMFPLSLDYLNIKHMEQPFYLGEQISTYFYSAQKVFGLLRLEQDSEIFEFIYDAVNNHALNRIPILSKKWEKILEDKARRIEDAVDKIKAKIEIIEDQKLIFYEMTQTENEGKFAIINYLSLYYPHYLYCGFTDYGHFISFTARSSTVSLLDLFSKVNMNIDDLKYGGHPFACGGRLDSRELGRLKELIIAELRKGKLKLIG